MKIIKFSTKLFSSLTLVTGLILLSCINESEKSTPSLIGQWKDTASYFYSIKDSLFEHELKNYEDSLGIKVIPFGPNWDSLRTELERRIKCDSTDCEKIIWTERSYIIFGSDSQINVITRNSKINWEYTSRYKIDQDSIYDCCNSSGQFVGLSYRMNKNRDTISLFYVVPKVYSKNEEILEK
jgi:hypothetical protein